MEEKFNIEFYTKKNGSVPFIDFYNSLDIKKKSRTIRYLSLLEKKGNKVEYYCSKKIDKYIYELRNKESNNAIRVLYFFYYDRQIIITNGFLKKSNKTPKNEIVLANKYRIDWISRRKKNEI